MRHITVSEFLLLKEASEEFQLIDIREPWETDCNIGGERIPMYEVPLNIDKISRDKIVVFHCNSGKRSDQIVRWLELNHKFTNLYSLRGGLQQWAKEVDEGILENC